MATNPMQRKARNSFLLGMLVMLLIAAVVIGFLVMQIMNYSKKEQEERAASVQVYVLSQDVSSGQVITNDMYTTLTVNRNLVPSNATSNLDIITNYSLEDKEGNSVITKYQNNVATLYLNKDNREYELKQEEETANYYIERNNNKEYVELNEVPLVAKVSMKQNTVLTTDLITKSDTTITDDLRTQEYNVFVLPMDLTTGDYVDFRLMMPSGQDFIVVSKKEVEIPQIDGVDSEDTIKVDLREDEILSLSSAIVDAYRVQGAKLYVTKYAEAGMQQAATPTYVVTAETAALISRNPNIVEKAMTDLRNRYNQINSSDIRNNYINTQINSSENADENLRTNMQESITNSKTTRKEYLDSLYGTTN